MYTWDKDNKFKCDLCGKRVSTIRSMNGGASKSLNLCIACHERIKVHYSEYSLAFKEEGAACL